MKACCKNDWSAVWEFISKRVYFLLTRHSVQSVCVLQMCYKCVTQAEQKPEKQSCLRITFEINRAEIKKCGKTSPSTSNTAEKDNCQIIIWWRINKSPNDWVSLWICCRLSLKTQSWRPIQECMSAVWNEMIRKLAGVSWKNTPPLFRQKQWRHGNKWTLREVYWRTLKWGSWGEGGVKPSFNVDLCQGDGHPSIFHLLTCWWKSHNALGSLSLCQR